MNNRPVIHIGANKTGSTTLQRALFPRSAGLVYLGEDCSGYDAYKDTLNSLVSDDDLYFQPEKTSDLFRACSAEADRSDKTFIYSNEDITQSRVPMLCAKRLHTLLPNAKILLVIRNQYSAVNSWYISHGAYARNVPRSYWRRYVSFDDWMSYCTTFKNYGPLDGFLYHQILSCYVPFFGKENVHVLLFEDFLHNKNTFIADLCKILNIDSKEALTLLGERRERKGKTLREFRYHQFRNSFFWGLSLSHFLPFGKQLAKFWNNFLAQGKPAGDFISESWRKKLREIYAEDNARLAREYDLPLIKYGYPIHG